MSGKHDAEFKKIFGDAATEKVTEFYKCSLYLDIHHPGKLFVTASAFFFYTVKNLDPSMSNPFAISGTFKEVESIEKNGIDGILFRKGGEEVVLDSFQYRNQAFAVLFHKWSQAKGKTVQQEGQTKPEFPPLDVHTKELLSRSIDGLPFFNDLGLLAFHYVVILGKDKIFDGPETRNLNSVERAKQLLSKVGQFFDKNFDQTKFAQKYDDYFKNYEAKKNMVDPCSMIEFLKTNPGEKTALVRCLKACIHPITTGVERIKLALTSRFQTKDKDWSVRVTLGDQIEILHIRNEQSSKGLFEIEWKMSMNFDKNAETLQKVWLYVTDLKFNPKTKEAIRYELQTLLKEFFEPAKSSLKGVVLLPSFADFSNQQLTSIPPEILQQTQLQTLYFHCNQLTSLPPEITQLQNLQVLYLNQNKFEAFPEVVLKMTPLSELHLGMNKISVVPSQISQLQNLRELSFSYNALKDIPVNEICQLTNLRKLYLHNNYLDNVPADLAKKLTHLKTLQIHNNRLKGALADFGPHDGKDVVEYLREQQ